MPVRPSLHLSAWKNSASTGRIFMMNFRKSAKKIQVYKNPTKIAVLYVKVGATSWKVAASIPDGVIGIFH
jgi:hypothetical protein